MVSTRKNNFESLHRPTPDDQQTLRHLARLYELIIQFRKDAARSDNPELRIQFDMAAEIIAGLARSFRLMENRSATECETPLDNPTDTETHPATPSGTLSGNSS